MAVTPNLDCRSSAYANDRQSFATNKSIDSVHREETNRMRGRKLMEDGEALVLCFRLSLLLRFVVAVDADAKQHSLHVSIGH